MLFLNRLGSLFASKPFSQGLEGQNPYKLAVFLTPAVHSEVSESQSEALECQRRIAKQQTIKQARIRSAGVHVETRRIVDADLLSSLEEMSEQDRKGIVAYVCGPPLLTDWAVNVLRMVKGMVGEKVLCEKWW